MFTHMRLETERLVIRPLAPIDAEPLQVICSDEQVMRYLPEDLMTLDEVREIIDWLQECYAKNTPDHIVKFTVGIDYRETGELIGWCGLGPLEYAPSEIEIFCGIARDFWNRGIATEACSAMLEYGFSVIGRHTIVAVVHPGNIASKRLVEKIGMVYRGQLGDNAETYGHYSNHHYYTMTRQENDIKPVFSVSGHKKGTGNHE